MSAVISISTRRPYGVARVCRVWGVSRAGLYRRPPGDRAIHAAAEARAAEPDA